MNIYIQSAEAISPQDTFDSTDFLHTLLTPEEHFFSCKTPDYKNYIEPKLLRRMSHNVRMGLATSLQALKKAGVESPDAIIVGTSLGCLDDTEKFLTQLIQSDEKLLNPTPFIQSTHNTVSGQIALLIGCKNYNFTFTQQAVSFETALIDASLSLQEDNTKNVLVGGLDEMNEFVYKLLHKAGCTKKEGYVNKGYIPGEGASFFVLSNKITEGTLAKIQHVSAFNVSDGLVEDLESILKGLGLQMSDIDVLINGENDDEDYDENYLEIKTALEESCHINYKQLVGEYDTASAFAMWLGAQIISQQTIPSLAVSNFIEKEAIKHLLVHNYSAAHQHSFIIISKC